MNKRFIRREIRDEIPEKENFVRIPAVMGDGNGNVRVEGNPGYVYIRFLSGQVWPAFNSSGAPTEEGYKIWVGTSKNMPLRLQVLGLRDVYGSPGTSWVEIDTSSLVWPEANTLWIRGEQYLPGLAIPSTTEMTIRFLPLDVVFNGAVVRVEDQTVDFSGYIPSTGAKWLLVEYDNAGTLNYIEGSLVGGRALLVPQDIPEATENSRHFWALKIYAGQEKFRWTVAQTDLVDLRWPGLITNAHDQFFTPLDTSDWDYLADPGNTGDALDQLADRIKSIEIASPNIHNELLDIQGGGDYLGFLEAYHLSRDEWEALVKGLNADAYHVHAGGGSWDGDITDIDETSSSDIGEDIADNDQGIIFNTSGSAWVRFAFSRLKTYLLGKAFALTGIITPTALTADENDYNPSGLSNATGIRLSGNFAWALTGLAGGTSGRIIRITNIGATFGIWLRDEDAGSSAANRFALYADYLIYPDESVLLQYDNTSQRWRRIGTASHAQLADIGSYAHSAIDTHLDEGTTFHEGLFEVSYSFADDNLAGVESRRYILDLSGLTANRRFTLPEPAGLGSLIEVYIKTGDATYDLEIWGDSLVTINGGSAASLWRSTDHQGDFFRFIATSTTNWEVIQFLPASIWDGSNADDLHAHFGKQLLIAPGAPGAFTVPASPSTYFAAIAYSGGVATAAPNYPLPFTGTLRELRVRTNSSQPASGTLVITIQINNSDTALTVTVPAGGGSATYSDSLNSVSVSADDLIKVKLVNNASATSAGMGYATLLYEFDA